MTSRNGTQEHAPSVLEVSDLTVGFPMERARVGLAVDGLNLEVRAGETLGIVGESGSGKSVSLRALLGIVPSPGRVLGGRAIWKGQRDLLQLSRSELREVRGKEIAMVFQDPKESLDPVYSIGDQLIETLTKRRGQSRRDAKARAAELLEKVGIPSAGRRLRDYPHQLSGGMRQRVMIAIAIACEPALLLADEPTTALDVTIQDQILSLLEELQEESGMAIVLVSHDLGVIAGACDKVAVMYAGRIVELGGVDQVVGGPRHPYTGGLLATVPAPAGTDGPRLEAIPGQPPSIGDLPEGCSFAPRCRFSSDACQAIGGALDDRSDGHLSACPFVNVSEHHDRAII